eukprot:TRINITY_DN22103_c0_g1_i1.p1 TRINITY_DN22103_c0_g1~~TRINITY_DN22103_c0_g1_i1.p1  ORF type:complete len:225 (-),score=59.44 TRINITY_DN22103_c0_g1_i1:399-1049(-)
MSDAEVDKAHKMYSRTMSSSYCQDKRTGLKTKHKKLIEIRSLSTPNFKQADDSEVLSPYVSLEMLDDPNYKATKPIQSPKYQKGASGLYDSESSSDSGSGLQMLGKPKLFKRPIRPAANKRRGCLTKSISVDKTLQIQPDKKSSTTETQQPHSKYLSKQRDNIKDIQVNTQPCGFDRRLAMDAVAKSRELRKGDFMTGAGGEEFFGSESDSSSTNL